MVNSIDDGEEGNREEKGLFQGHGKESEQRAGVKFADDKQVTFILPTLHILI